MLTINYCYTGMCFLERYGRSRGEKGGQRLELKQRMAAVL